MSVVVHPGSAERMREVEDESVALTVTSPPYWNAIDYDRFVKDRALDWKSRSYAKGFESYEDFLSLLRRVFTEVWRVTRPGGFCAVVVATILHEGRAFPLPYDVVNGLTEIGWRFHQDFAWHKIWTRSRRGAVLVQYPYPGNYHPNPVWEHILVFRRPATHAAMRRLRRGRCPEHRIAIDRLYTREISNNLWHVRPVPPGRIEHPCPFPEEIPHRLITLYSAPGELVLDPFAGSGQALKVARALGRRAVGYDREEAFAQLARQRAHAPYVRGPQLVASFVRVDPVGGDGDGGA